MSGVTQTSTQVFVPYNDFAATAKNLVADATEINETYDQQDGLTLPLVERALGTDFTLRSAIKHLSTMAHIQEHAEELHDLVTARELMSRNIFPISIPQALQQMADSLLNSTTETPKELLEDLLTSQPEAAEHLPSIYEELADLSDIAPGEKEGTTPQEVESIGADRGKELFEDETQDRATIAQAIFNVAHKHDVLTQQDLELRTNLYQHILKADKVFADTVAKLYPEQDTEATESFTATVILGGETTTTAAPAISESSVTDLSDAQSQIQKMKTQMEKMGIALTEDPSTRTETPSHVRTQIQSPKIEVTNSVGTGVQSSPASADKEEFRIDLQNFRKAVVNTNLEFPEMEVTTSVGTEVQPSPEEEELRTTIESLRALKELNSAPVFDSNEPTFVTTGTTDFDKILQQAQNELSDNVQTSALSDQREKLTQEAALSLVEVNDIQTQLVTLLAKIAEVDATIEKDEGVHASLSEKHKSAQQNVDKLNQEEQNAQAQIKLREEEVLQAQAQIDEATKNVQAAQAKISEATENLRKTQVQINELTEKSQEIEATLALNTKQQTTPDRNLITKAREVSKNTEEANQLAKTLALEIVNAEETLNINKQALAKAEELLATTKKAVAEAEQIAAGTKKAIAEAEVEMFGYPMQIADVTKRLETAKQERVKLTEESALKDNALLKAKGKHAEIDQRLNTSIPPAAGTKQQPSVEQIKASIGQVLNELLSKEFWGLPSPAQRSAIVLNKISHLPDDIQERIKEHVFVQSTDQAKTRETDAWINAHIGDDTDLIWSVLEEAMK